MKKTSFSLDNNFVVASLILVWLMLTAYLRPLLLPDEGRYADVAREMLNGSWFVPTLNGLPFFHKPPLLYWLDILAMKIFGINMLTIRMGSILGAWACATTVFVLMRRWYGMRTATLTLIVLATSPLFYLGAQYDNHDMLVASLISIAILLMVRAVEDPVSLSRRHVWAAYAVCALAVLSKGLIGIVIPVMVIAPWLLIMGRWKTLIQLIDYIGIGIFLLICLPWFIAMQLYYPDFFHYFFVYQHVDRFLHTTFNNAQPAWFFFVALPLLTLPWALFAPAAVLQVWRQRTPLQLLSIWWLLFTLIFFSLMRSKLVGYIMPAIVPGVILLALWMTTRSDSLKRWVATFAAVICVVTALWITKITPDSHRVVASMLSSQMAANDRVVFVGDFFYDIPFYAHLEKPILVIEDWHSPDMEIVDNWRQELKHASNFDVQRGKERLIDSHDLASLQSLSCTQSTLWFVVQKGEKVAYPELFSLRKIYAKQDVELYQSSRAERGCALLSLR